MSNRIALTLTVDVRPHFRDRQTVERGEKLGRGSIGERLLGTQRPIGSLGEIQLDAVAGAENDRFAAETHGDGVESTMQRLAVEGQPFAHRDRGVLVTTADGEEDHRRPPLLPLDCIDE